MRLTISAVVLAASAAVVAAPPTTPTPLTLELKDFATLPITGTLDGAGQVDGMLARVNSIREEPGRRKPAVRHRHERPDLSPRQEDQSARQRISTSTGAASARASSIASITTRDTAAASASSSSIPTTGATASSTRCTWKGSTFVWIATARYHEDSRPCGRAFRVRANGRGPHAGTDHLRIDSDRVDRQQPAERHVRGHGARSVACAAESPHPSDG